ncbi:MAG: tyrosine-type recombinase/integrase [Proteobacteria bacterium]|nr:tyrosine-type recombinase/integrase [Pseudomonadota bacterium]
MPTATKPLTINAVKNAKPGKHFDGGGLYIEVMPNGSRWWRLKYRIGGKEKRLGFGVFPEVSLAEARQKRDEARATLREGRDPSVERQAENLRVKLATENTFGAVAAEWLSKQHKSLSSVTLGKAEWLLGLAAALNDRPIAGITAADVLAVVQGVEARGTHDTAHRVKQRIGAVMRYAIVTGRIDSDVTRDLRGALVPFKSRPRSALTDPAAVADLLRAIHGYTGQPTTLAALKLAPMLFARPGNLRAMEWTELDLDAAEWRIPGGKMKMREEHVIPLPAQAVEILRALQPLTGRGRYCFPSLRSSARPMSENTVNAALRRLGYDKHTMTGHGFRALASTRLNELGWQPDVIERQLAHVERNAVRGVYNRAAYMAERTKMMQSFADYLDALRMNTNVTPIRKAG